MASDYQLATSRQLQPIPMELEAIAAPYTPDAQIGTIWWISSEGKVSACINSMPLGKFQEIVKFDKDRFLTAKRVANSLWNYKKYSDLYLDYVQGSIEEGEFHA